MVLEHPFCQGMLFVQECLSLLSYVWCPPLVPKHATGFTYKHATGFRFTTEFTTPHNVWIGGLVNIVTPSVNTIMGQMTELS